MHFLVVHSVTAQPPTSRPELELVVAAMLPVVETSVERTPEVDSADIPELLPATSTAVQTILPGTVKPRL